MSPVPVPPGIELPIAQSRLGFRETRWDHPSTDIRNRETGTESDVAPRNYKRSPLSATTPWAIGRFPSHFFDKVLRPRRLPALPPPLRIEFFLSLKVSTLFFGAGLWLVSVQTAFQGLRGNKHIDLNTSRMRLGPEAPGTARKTVFETSEPDSPRCQKRALSSEDQ